MRRPLRGFLFDLGGVIFSWRGIEAVAALTGTAMTKEEVRRAWLKSEWVRKHETGNCTSGEFARGIIAEFSLPLAPDSFLAAFAGWLGPVFPGALDLLDSLSADYELACISNVSRFHWEQLLADSESHAVLQRFGTKFLSFETGIMKPDTVAFENVIRHWAVAPPEAVFFDDNRECVEAAKNVQFQAFEVSGVEEIRDIIQGGEVTLKHLPRGSLAPARQETEI